MPQRFLKPTTPGLIVRKPETGVPLAPEGELVEDSTYWHRRIADGDVTESRPSRPPSSKPSATKAATD